MKKIKILPFTFFIIFSFFYSELKASHVLGGDVSYRHLGNKKYELKFVVYRDCRGIAFNNPTISATGGNYSYYLTYTRVSIEDITFKCQDSTRNPCSPSNTVQSKGIEKHTYLDTIDFDVSPYTNLVNNNCQVMFTMEQCCRNGAITTFSPGNFYVEAMINVCNSNYVNSSPQYYSNNNVFTFCNKAQSQNYGGIDNIDNDSIVYKLERPKNAPNSYDPYSSPFSSGVPLTPYCPPNIGTTNCKPLPNAKPPRGFYFESNTGNIIYTPVSCDEYSVINMLSYEYRKYNDSWLLVGFSARDIGVIVVDNNNAMTPEVKYSTTNFNFKTREKKCFDITTLDSNYTGKDKSNNTEINLLYAPKGSSFSYLDSSTINKSARFCWTPHDTDYLSINQDIKYVPVLIEVKDRHCYSNAQYLKLINLRVLPPDSIGKVKINTYVDKNNNKNYDNSDSLVNVKLKINQNSNAYYRQSNGKFEENYRYGNYTIGIANQPYISTKSNDTNLRVIMDSIHQLNLFLKYNKGIYGRIFHDKNSNCMYDSGDVPLSNYVVYTDTGNYTGISDAFGMYYIYAPAGTYSIYCSMDTIKNKLNCSSKQFIGVVLPVDSAYFNNDIPISLNYQFKDLSTYIELQSMRRGSVGAIKINCNNNGYTTMRNFKLIIPDIKKYSFTYNNGNNTYQGDTAVFTIDSIKPFSTYSIYGGVYADPNIKFPNWKMCIKVYTDTLIMKSDSNHSNNLFKTCVDITRPYDPNDKRITNDSIKTTIDKEIRYKIRFQNKGNDTAVRVMVIDTINTAFLDLTKFKLINSQYPCSVSFKDNLIYFIFDNIYLPYESKSNEKSIGEFEFSLGLKNGFKQETSFENSAAIYFDFEDPVITKISIASIVSPLEIVNLKYTNSCINAKNNLSYKSNIALEKDNILTLELSDSNGNFENSMVLKKINKNDDTGSIEFDFPNSIKDGQYLIRLKSSKPESVSIPQNGIVGINLFKIPKVKLSTNLIDDKICEYDSLKFKLDNVNYLYKIVKNNNYSSGYTSNTEYSYIVNLLDQFKIIINDLNITIDCYDTISIPFEVKELPKVKLSIANRKLEYCENEEITIRATGANIYTYFKDEIPWINQSTMDSVTYSLNQNTSFKIKGVDSNLCSNTTDTLFIKVNPMPNSSISVTPNPSCYGDSIFIHLDNRYVHNVFVEKSIYRQNFVGEKLHLNPVVNGSNISAETIDTNKCKQITNKITIVSNDKPEKPKILVSDNNLLINTNLSIKWYHNGNLLNSNLNYINNALSGTYWATISNSDGCHETSDTVYFQNTDINELYSNLNLTIFPNPSNNEITIEFNKENNCNVNIIDVSGREIFTTINKGNKQLKIDVSSLSKGIYTVQIMENNSGISYYKLIIN